jgi:PAS domain-containing protein
MRTLQPHIQERLGSAMHALAIIEGRVSGRADGKALQGLLKECRRLVVDLERGFSLLQEATAHNTDLRQQVESATGRARVLFELSPLPCMVLDGSGTVADANAAATRLLNMSLRHLQEKQFDLFVSTDREGFRTWLGAAARGTETARRGTTIRPRERRPKEVVVTAVPEADGRIALVLLDPAVSDVEATALSEVEREFQT